MQTSTANTETRSRRSTLGSGGMGSIIDMMDDTPEEYDGDDECNRDDAVRLHDRTDNSGTKKNAAADGDKSETQSSGVFDYLRRVVGSCGGVVDIASYIMESHSTCGGETVHRRGALPKDARQGRPELSPRNRDDATLEFVRNPNGFADDVSVLSDNTFREMERLGLIDPRLARSRSQRTHEDSAVASPRVDDRQTEWAYRVARETSFGERSLAVSTSVSSTSVEVEHVDRSA